MCLYRIVFAAAIFMSAGSVFAQMPGWATIRDSDGNKFFIDQNFRIYTSQKPDEKYKPVSIDGIEYYIEQGQSLIKRHFVAEGLRLLKGVKLLADTDARAFSAGKRASQLINSLINREKERYLALDHETAVVLTRNGVEHFVSNDWMRYSFSNINRISVISRKFTEKIRYARDSTAFGLSFAGRTETFYDAIITITAEEFPYEINSIEKYEEIWKNKNPDEIIERKILEQGEKRILYSLDRALGIYSGYDLFIVHGMRGYHVRIFAPKEKAGERDNAMKKAIESFKTKGGV